ncbi:MAG: murein biosynthesis integral membrane protein MurJ [Sphaerochaetaceae bacterium]|jgi:putative peptidoglycan lipid II flippase
MDSNKRSKNSLMLMILTFVSRLLGIIRSRTVAIFFGATNLADIINFSFNIPNNFRKLFAEGSLSSAYIPQFASLADDKGSSQNLLNEMQGFQLLITTFLVILTFLFKTQIFSFLSDFKDPNAIQLGSIFLFYFVLFLVAIIFATLYAGVLHSHQRFLIAAVSPLIFSIAVISSLYLLTTEIGAFSFVVGVLIGGFSQALINFIALRRVGYKFRFSFNFKNESFLKVLKAWGPITAVTLLAVIAQQIAFYFASTLKEGSITAFSNAIILYQAPYGIFYSGIATVFFPAMALAFYSKDDNKLVELVAKALLYIATFLIPSAIVLTTFSSETTAVVLQSGLFSYQDTLLTSSILKWFAIGMPIVAFYSFFQRVYYSTNQLKRALIGSIVVVSLDIVLTYLLLKFYPKAEFISLANSISHLVGLIILIYYWPYKGKLINYLKQFAILLIANVPLLIYAISYRVFNNREWLISGSTKRNLLILFVLYLGALIITLISYTIAKVDYLNIFKPQSPQSK